MTVLPGGAPMMRPIWSPTVIGISHQPSPQARMPRSRHMRAYSSRRVLGGGGHRGERVVDQIGAVAEDREAVAIGEQIRHAAGKRITRGVDELALLDWKRRIFALYAEVRAADVARSGAGSAGARCGASSTARIRSRRASAASRRYFPYDPALRFEASVEQVEPRRSRSRAARAARRASAGSRVARFGGTASSSSTGSRRTAAASSCRSATARADAETYGAGRYLLDTVKGADLGGGADSLVLDFNFAFNPSCAWNDRWACPLAPPANRLALRIEGGELTPPAERGGGTP